MSRSLRFPFAIGDLHVPRAVKGEAVAREQLHQLLFTLPGERVGRPDFGCGVQRLVFAGMSDERLAAAEFLIGQSVRRHLSHLLSLEAVSLSTNDSTLYIDILFTLLSTGEERSLSFTQPLQGAP